MKEHIYRLLNQTLQDIDRFETEQLTDEEVNMIMAKFKKEINTGNANKKRKMKRSTLAVIIAAVVAVCCGTVAVAADHMGVFNKLVHKKDMTFSLPDVEEELPIDKFAVQYDYEKIADAAKPETDTITAEAEGFTLQVDSVYCDGMTLMIGISGSMKDGNPTHKQLINLDMLTIRINDTLYGCLPNPEGFASLDGSLVLDEGTENQFSGDIILILLQDAEITEPTTVNVSAGRITAQEHYMDSNYVELGNLKFSVDVMPDASLREQEAYTITEDGDSIRFYEISPAMMIVGFRSSDPNISSWLNDENGEQIEQMGMAELPDYGDGYSIGCMVPVDNGYVTATFFNKNDSDENGNPIHIKEIRINMDEVTAALKGNTEGD